MKAILYKEYGSPEVLRAEEIEKPVVGTNEVLVKIKATSVTNADCFMRRADTFFSRMVLGFFKPKKRYQILGTEFSGIVETVGKDVKDWIPGQEVFGFRGFGTGCYAEYKCISSSGSLELKPENMSFEEAATLVDGATTALFFLKDKAKITRGQKVLINGASGSIGTFAVQLAKYLGAEVTGVCSTRNIELVKSLGADHVIDYTKEDFTTIGKTYDIIFDTIGKSNFGSCRKILVSDGKYMSTIFNLSVIIQTFYTRLFAQKKVLFGMSVNKTAALKTIKKLYVEGKIQSVIDRKYTLEQIAEAHAYVEQGHKRGNVAIVI